ncbi:MAG TPA: response regulator, partial [Anaerolineae bacterium]|nr:response regulator [Anaerolineae bacterium]
RQQHLADLRHELRSFLNVIFGYSEILVEYAEDEGLEHLVPDLLKIRAAGGQILALVSASLDPTRAGQPDPDPETAAAELDFELRTSLTTIIGYAEMLLEDAAEKGPRDWFPDLQEIHAAATGFLALLDDVADAFKARAGRGDTEHVTADSPATVPDATVTAVPFPEDDKDLRPDEVGRILVVDDNELNRNILTHHLQAQGHTVAMAENGRQALELISSDSFDLVLLDIMMPEMDGYQVLRRLKGDDIWRNIPVIMISALGEMDSVVWCIELGAEDYLSKPFDPVLLRARIGACLEKKRLRDQEVEYLRNVACVTAAAAAVEAGEYDPDSLITVAQRIDSLGQLARVFQSMAREVYAREERLKRQVRELCIELSEARQARQVAEITETEYFRRLQAEAQDLRDILEGLDD